VNKVRILLFLVVVNDEISKRHQETKESEISKGTD